MKYVAGALPPDLKKYVLVKSKEGWHWRVRRGWDNPNVRINSTLQQQANLTKISGPAAVKLREALQIVLAGLNCGRLTLKLSGVIRKGLKKGNWPDDVLLKKLDFQPRYPFTKVMP